MSTFLDTVEEDVDVETPPWGTADSVEPWVPPRVEDPPQPTIAVHLPMAWVGAGLLLVSITAIVLAVLLGGDTNPPPANPNYAGIPGDTASPTAPAAVPDPTAGPSPEPATVPAPPVDTEPSPTCRYPDGTVIPPDQIYDYWGDGGGSFPTYLSGCAIDRRTGGYWTYTPPTTPATTTGPIDGAIAHVRSHL